MVRKGFLMNIISILILTLFVFLVLPELWGIVIQGYPKNLVIKP
jgi:sodium-dependent dicarboxylate transporter 2/3/5